MKVVVLNHMSLDGVWGGYSAKERHTRGTSASTPPEGSGVRHTYLLSGEPAPSLRLWLTMKG